jgi:hypothetical protein
MWMKVGIDPRRSSSVCNFTAALVEQNGAHGNIDSSPTFRASASFGLMIMLLAGVMQLNRQIAIAGIEERVTLRRDHVEGVFRRPGLVAGDSHPYGAYHAHENKGIFGPALVTTPPYHLLILGKTSLSNGLRA